MYIKIDRKRDREREGQLEVNESEAWAEAGNENASRKLQFNWLGVERKVNSGGDGGAGSAALTKLAKTSATMSHARNWLAPHQLERKR